ncbi:hypothetical protein GCM10009552_04540 [Rothia nasimurium]|uniref:HEXXH motif domain-containing protein n=1 Tax=Luteibacter anthropi TaxID=564369 RepID=A0A7X5ZJP7_9GAMM|nr:HEXXH motif-containing putative peptide modification protein [Luteibacter anthropi]NII07956.1 hypothetical protein [Luteibacter anthropi]
MNGYVLGCASPQSSLHGESPDFLAFLFQRAVLRKITREAGMHPLLARVCTDVLHPLGEDVVPSALCWQPETGAALVKLRRGKPAHAVVSALLALHVLGYGATWALTIDEPGRFSFDGHFFDLAGDIEVVATPASLRIECQGMDRYALSFERGADGWCIQGAVDDVFAYSAPRRLGDSEFRGVYLQPWKEPDDALNIIDIVIDWPPKPDEAALFDGRVSPSAIAAQVDEALAIMRSADPCYTRWIRPLFRGIATTPLLADGMRQSGSYIDHPGVFNFGFPSAPEGLGEGIVHEMSHQYLMLLSAVSPLVNDNHGEVYYSSLKRRKRSLDRVLLAFHACANMSLYWLDLIDKMGHRKDRDDELASMLAHTHELASVLRASAGLTDTGRLLFDTQVQALREKGEAVIAA